MGMNSSDGQANTQVSTNIRFFVSSFLHFDSSPPDSYLTPTLYPVFHDLCLHIKETHLLTLSIEQNIILCKILTKTL